MKCTAHKTDGTPCNAYAMKGKDVCRVHGGKTPIKHGLYSKYKDLYWGERTAELIEDEDLLDLRHSIALVRAMLEDFLKRLGEQGGANQSERRAVLEMVEGISKNIERLVRLENLAKEQEVPKVLIAFVEHVTAIANASIKHDEDRRQFAQSVARFAGNGSGDGHRPALGTASKREAAPAEG